MRDLVDRLAHVLTRMEDCIRKRDLAEHIDFLWLRENIRAGNAEHQARRLDMALTMAYLFGQGEGEEPHA